MRVLGLVACLLLKLAMARAVPQPAALVAKSQPQAALISAKRAVPEPYGHTAQISPLLPNTDREWYTEYRWQKGQEYKPQDGVITTKPKHAPTPKPIEEKKSKSFGKPLNKKPVRKPEQAVASSNSTKTAKPEPAGKVPNWNPADDAKKVDAKEVSWQPSPSPAKPNKGDGKDVDLDSKKAVRPPGVGTAADVKPEPKYAVPKPCGHTSMVHPYNANSDREWYIEYRWKPGTEYKPQDGPITEKPKAAKGIFAKPTYKDPCV